MVVIMTSQTPIVDIPEVTDQQREWQVTLHLYVYMHVQSWGDERETRHILTQHRVNLRVLAGEPEQIKHGAAEIPIIQTKTGSIKSWSLM